MKLLLVFIMCWACAYAFLPKLTLSLVKEEKDEDNYWKIPKISLIPKFLLFKSAKKEVVSDLLETKLEKLLEKKLAKLPLLELLEHKKEAVIEKVSKLKTEIAKKPIHEHPHHEHHYEHHPHTYGCITCGIDDCHHFT